MIEVSFFSIKLIKQRMRQKQVIGSVIDTHPKQKKKRIDGFLNDRN